MALAKRKSRNKPLAVVLVRNVDAEAVNVAEKGRRVVVVNRNDRDHHRPNRNLLHRKRKSRNLLHKKKANRKNRSGKKASHVADPITS